MSEFERQLYHEINKPRDLDFATLRNPYGSSRLCSHAELLFPSASERDLKIHISEWLNIPTDQIAFGANGSSEIINLLPRLFLTPGDSCLVCPPTYFGLYDSLAASDNKVTEIPTRPEDGYIFDDKFLDQLLLSTKAAQPGIIWLCSPNNPTGAVVPIDMIEMIASQNPESLIVIDEAYHEYIDPANQKSAVRLIETHPNILVTKTFSKAFGLSQIRIGVAIGNPDVIQMINETNHHLPIVSASAAKAAASLMDLKHLYATKFKVEQELTRFYENIRMIPNIEVGARSETGVIILRHKYLNLWEELISRGVKTLNCQNLNGIVGQGFIRIGLQTHEENAVLIKILQNM